MKPELAYPDAGRCLNCGADLHGHFCGACGQRSVPADPTVRELVGDAWQEFSGYDGRIAETFRSLLRPGRVTKDYIEGRRARYLSPVKLYLTVSVVYFVIAAAAPQLSSGDGKARGGGLQVSVTQSSDRPIVTEEDRAEMLKDLETAPWFLRPILKAVAEDATGFRARMFGIMPRVFFALLPVFAGIVSLFYRSRRFPTALVYALHIHAVAFLVFGVAEAAKFTRAPALAGTVALAASVIFAVYALRSLRAVFGGGWPVTLAKAAGISFVYSLAAVPAFTIILFWASLT